MTNVMGANIVIFVVECLGLVENECMSTDTL